MRRGASSTAHTSSRGVQFRVGLDGIGPGSRGTSLDSSTGVRRGPMNQTGTLEQAGPSAGRTTMRNPLLMGVMVSALSFVTVPASAQVAADAPIAAPRSQDDAGEPDDYEYDNGSESSYGPYRPAGFGVQVYGGGSANEYGPYVYQFNRRTGKRIAVFTLPDIFAIRNLSAMGQNEINGNKSGRVSNKGMEGLAITPDGRTLVGIMQSPLLQDGGTNGSTTRIVTIDIETGAVLHQYGYRFDNIGTVGKPKYGTASDLLALNDHEFLVDERDGKGLGDDSVASFKRLYKINLDGAVDVSTITDPAVLTSCAVSKSLFLDIVTVLTAEPVRMSAADIPAKLEGTAFGEDVVIDGVVKHTLYVSNDNDFVPVITDTRHLSGLDNPNTFFVFAFDDDDLQGSELVPQQLVHHNQGPP